VEEARYSFNVKVIIQGFECCFTFREDQPGKCPDLVDRSLQAVAYLSTKGAQPIRPYTVKTIPAVVPSATTVPAPAATVVPPPAPAPAAVAAPASKTVEIPVCKNCHSSDNMELIEFEKDGKLKAAWKCQTCQKWYR
jgi:hypothetical protein